MKQKGDGLLHPQAPSPSPPPHPSGKSPGKAAHFAYNDSHPQVLHSPALHTETKSKHPLPTLFSRRGRRPHLGSSRAAIQCCETTRVAVVGAPRTPRAAGAGGSRLQPRRAGGGDRSGCKVEESWRSRGEPGRARAPGACARSRRLPRLQTARKGAGAEHCPRTRQRGGNRSLRSFQGAPRSRAAGRCGATRHARGGRAGLVPRPAPRAYPRQPSGIRRGLRLAPTWEESWERRGKTGRASGGARERPLPQPEHRGAEAGWRGRGQRGE